MILQTLNPAEDWFILNAGNPVSPSHELACIWMWAEFLLLKSATEVMFLTQELCKVSFQLFLYMAVFIYFLTYFINLSLFIPCFGSGLSI